jgi:class 3 adenylate cyclase
VGDGARPGPSDFEAMGLYDPDAPDAAGRLALFEYLVAQGATLDDFALVRPNELPAVASLVALFPERDFVSLEDAADRADVSVDFVRRFWRAAGFPDPAPGDENVLAGTADVLGGLSASVEFFGEEETLQMVRLLGSAAARIADAGISMFVVNTAPGSVQRDPSLVELAQLNTAAVAFVPEIVRGFDVLLRYHLHLARRFDDRAVDGVEIQPRTIGFVDLVGSTGLATALGPKELRDAFADFDATSTDVVTARGGRVIKFIGDEVMFVTPHVDVAVEIALDLVDAFAHHDVLPPVRAALATGDVVARGGDYSGAIVNLAARAVKIARPGTLLVDAATSRQLDPDGFSTRFVRAFSLKGFDQRVALHRVRRAT